MTKFILLTCNQQKYVDNISIYGFKLLETLEKATSPLHIGIPTVEMIQNWWKNNKACSNEYIVSTFDEPIDIEALQDLKTFYNNPKSNSNITFLESTTNTIPKIICLCFERTNIKSYFGEEYMQKLIKLFDNIYDIQIERNYHDENLRFTHIKV